MIHYKGDILNDIPNGAGAYVAENHDGGEVLNFLPIKGKYYGYARIRKGNNLRIERLGVNRDAPYIDDITVVFFATDPILGGQKIVGWYNHAMLYRKVQTDVLGREPQSFYITVTAKKNGTLLSVGDRKMEVPEDGPGQTNAWYVNEYHDAQAFLKKFELFKSNPSLFGGPLPTIKSGSGWQQDIEKRKLTELAAMDATFKYFTLRGFKVNYVHQQKLGWDMEAKKGKTEFRLEVKGSCNPLESILLTLNEYLHSKQHQNFRVCILESALDEKLSQLHICQLSKDKGYWHSDTGRRLRVEEIKSAKLINI